MPSFEDMKKRYSSAVIGEQLKEMSNMVMNETFSNSTSYRKGMIYDCNMLEIQEMEFRFIKTKTYFAKSLFYFYLSINSLIIFCFKEV